MLQNLWSLCRTVRTVSDKHWLPLPESVLKYCQIAKTKTWRAGCVPDLSAVTGQEEIREVAGPLIAI